MTTDENPQAPAARTKSRLTTALPVIVGLGLLVLVTYALLSSDDGRPQPGDYAPDFTLTLFDGLEMSLKDLHGQVVVLNFWASWCTSCRQEAPELQKTWEMFEDQGVTFLGVTFKDAGDASRDAAREAGITYPNGIDVKNRISSAYGVSAVPETFIIDREGKIVWFHAGAVNAETLVEQLAQVP
jgi:peroxiredoxin